MNLADFLTRSARLRPEAPAVAWGGREAIVYRDLALRAASLGAALTTKLGCPSGGRVGIVAANCAEYIEVLFACWYAGLVVVPINSKLHPKELEYIFSDAEIGLAFATSELAGGIPKSADVIDLSSPEYEQLIANSNSAQVSVETHGGDPAWLFYTSGTTGQPKGATLSHTNLMQMTLAYFADIGRPEPGHTLLHAAPMSHGSGLYALPHIANGSLNLIPESRGFEPQEIFDALSRNKRVSLFTAPTMVTRLIAHPDSGAADFRELETIIYGGAPMYVSDTEQAIDLFGPRLYNLYGQGESPMTISGLPQSAHADRAHPRFADRLGSCGLPRSGVEIRIVDEAGAALPPGQVGEIATRSACTMVGYWNNPEATAKTIRDGWLHTGDLGSLDEEGFLTLQDRAKDLIISGGSNIYPREVEEVLLREDAVAECSVVGRSHPDWGEEVVAFIVAKPGAVLDEARLDSVCLENIARFKRPKQYCFVDTLPKNNYGKVLKTELRRIASDAKRREVP